MALHSYYDCFPCFWGATFYEDCAAFSPPIYENLKNYLYVHVFAIGHDTYAPSVMCITGILMHSPYLSTEFEVGTTAPDCQSIDQNWTVAKHHFGLAPSLSVASIMFLDRRSTAEYTLYGFCLRCKRHMPSMPCPAIEKLHSPV